MKTDWATWQLWLFAMPSLVVFYLMVCLINSKRRTLFKWDIKTVGNWAYLLFLCSSVFTWAEAWQHRDLPHWDKILMDVAACLYFGQRGYRVMKVRRKGHGLQQ